MTLKTATQEQVDTINRLTEERDLSLTWEPGVPETTDAANSATARVALKSARMVWRNVGYLPDVTARTLIAYLEQAPKKETP